MALTVCLSAFYVCLKHLWGRVGFTDGFFARKPALKRLASFERKSERTFRAKEPSVDPTRQVNMSVFCAEVFIVNWRADLRSQFASASEATATWRFTNFVLYCIVIQ